MCYVVQVSVSTVQTTDTDRELATQYASNMLRQYLRAGELPLAGTETDTNKTVESRYQNKSEMISKLKISKQVCM